MTKSSTKISVFRPNYFNNLALASPLHAFNSRARRGPRVKSVRITQFILLMIALIAFGTTLTSCSNGRGKSLSDLALSQSTSTDTSVSPYDGPCKVTAVVLPQNPIEVDLGVSPINYNVEIRNPLQSGPSCDFVLTTNTLPAQWTAGPNVPITLRPQESRILALSVTPPQGLVAGDYPIVVRATSVLSHSTSDAPAIIKVGGGGSAVCDYAPQLSAFSSAVTLGHTGVVRFKIKNTGAATCLIEKVAADANNVPYPVLPQNWTLQQITPTLLTLIPGESKWITLNVTAPSTGLIDEDIYLSYQVKDHPELFSTVKNSVRMISWITSITGSYYASSQPLNQFQRAIRAKVNDSANVQNISAIQMGHSAEGGTVSWDSGWMGISSTKTPQEYTCPANQYLVGFTLYADSGSVRGLVPYCRALDSLTESPLAGVGYNVGGAFKEVCPAPLVINSIYSNWNSLGLANMQFNCELTPSQLGL